jgi:Ser/Thr protein kinase RdoA (MazF antagonist)
LKKNHLKSNLIKGVLQAYGFSDQIENPVLYGSGLIHSTWKFNHQGSNYILQQINNKVFKDPYSIASNIQLVSNYLQHSYTKFLFVTPVLTLAKEPIYLSNDNTYFRIFQFVEGSHSINVVTKPQQAYEAARQFGKFTYLLRQFDCNKLKLTIPDFHNLTLRYDQFVKTTIEGNKDRIQQSDEFIRILKGYQSLVTDFNQLKKNAQFKIRITHHDTKISNVLFDDEEKGICVIDLDTMMPGYFISDVGDMMRTYLSPANEEETDLSLIKIREDYFHSIVTGYLSEMEKELTVSEKNHIVYAGKFMIFMQALRFLADHLNNDQYYGARYENHNLDRAKNQICLLQRFEEKSEAFENIVRGA